MSPIIKKDMEQLKHSVDCLTSSVISEIKTSDMSFEEKGKVIIELNKMNQSARSVKKLMEIEDESTSTA